MIQLEVVRIAQEYDFKQRVTVNFLYLELPNGQIVRAMVSDEDVAVVIAADVQDGGAPSPVMAQAAQSGHAEAPGADAGEILDIRPLPMMEGEDGMPIAVFGGGAATFEPPAGPVPPSLHRQVPRQRKIQADDRGNPIMAQQGGVDPDAMLGRRSGGGEAPPG